MPASTADEVYSHRVMCVNPGTSSILASIIGVSGFGSLILLNTEAQWSSIVNGQPFVPGSFQLYFHDKQHFA